MILDILTIIGIDLTRMECKASETPKLGNDGNPYRFNQNGM